MANPDDAEPAPDADELAALRAECALLRRTVARMRRQLDDALPVLAAVRDARIWDFVPYQVELDPDWLAIDRDDVERLMGALAANDHWRPWTQTLERRLETR